MKKNFAKALLLVVVAFAVNASAEPNEAKAKVYDHGTLMGIFKTSLKSEIPGIVESTIYNIVEYKSRYPNLDYSKMIAALNTLAEDISDSSISYKAHLATLYLSYGESIAKEPAFDTSNHELAFQAINKQLEMKFLLTRATE